MEPKIKRDMESFFNQKHIDGFSGKQSWDYSLHVDTAGHLYFVDIPF